MKQLKGKIDNTIYPSLKFIFNFDNFKLNIFVVITDDYNKLGLSLNPSQQMNFIDKSQFVGRQNLILLIHSFQEQNVNNVLEFFIDIILKNIGVNVFQRLLFTQVIPILIDDLNEDYYIAIKQLISQFQQKIETNNQNILNQCDNNQRNQIDILNSIFNQIPVFKKIQNRICNINPLTPNQCQILVRRLQELKQIINECISQIKSTSIKQFNNAGLFEQIFKYNYISDYTMVLPQQLTGFDNICKLSSIIQQGLQTNMKYLSEFLIDLENNQLKIVFQQNQTGKNFYFGPNVINQQQECQMVEEIFGDICEIRHFQSGERCICIDMRKFNFNWIKELEFLLQSIFVKFVNNNEIKQSIQIPQQDQIKKICNNINFYIKSEEQLSFEQYLEELFRKNYLIKPILSSIDYIDQFNKTTIIINVVYSNLAKNILTYSQLSSNIISQIKTILSQLDDVQLDQQTINYDRINFIHKKTSYTILIYNSQFAQYLQEYNEQKGLYYQYFCEIMPKHCKVQQSSTDIVKQVKMLIIRFLASHLIPLSYQQLLQIDWTFIPTIKLDEQNIQDFTKDSFDKLFQKLQIQMSDFQSHQSINIEWIELFVDYIDQQQPLTGIISGFLRCLKQLQTLCQNRRYLEYVKQNIVINPNNVEQKENKLFSFEAKVQHQVKPGIQILTLYDQYGFVGQKLTYDTLKQLDSIIQVAISYLETNPFGSIVPLFKSGVKNVKHILIINEKLAQPFYKHIFQKFYQQVSKSSVNPMTVNQQLTFQCENIQKIVQKISSPFIRDEIYNILIPIILRYSKAFIYDMFNPQVLYYSQSDKSTRDLKIQNENESALDEISLLQQVSIDTGIIKQIITREDLIIPIEEVDEFDSIEEQEEN